MPARSPCGWWRRTRRGATTRSRRSRFRLRHRRDRLRSVSVFATAARPAGGRSVFIRLRALRAPPKPAILLAITRENAGVARDRKPSFDPKPYLDDRPAVSGSRPLAPPALGRGP